VLICWKWPLHDICKLILIIAECGISCHKRCQSKFPNLCGVNEKLLAEALRNVKEEKKIRHRLEVCICVLFINCALDKVIMLLFCLLLVDKAGSGEVLLTWVHGMKIFTFYKRIWQILQENMFTIPTKWECLTCSKNDSIKFYGFL